MLQEILNVIWNQKNVAPPYSHGCFGIPNYQLLSEKPLEELDVNFMFDGLTEEVGESSILLKIEGNIPTPLYSKLNQNFVYNQDLWELGQTQKEIFGK